MKTKIIVVSSGTGGDGRTMVAAHHVYFGKELGLKVAGVSIDRNNDLRQFLRPAGLAWFDGLCDELPSDLDLLVFDVCDGAKSVEVIRPDLWLLLVDDLNAELAAAGLAPTLAGRVMRVRNYWHGYALPDDKRDLSLESTDVVLHRCNALAAATDAVSSVWSSKLGAYSAGARTLRELVAEVFGYVGLLQSEDPPYEQRRGEAPQPFDTREQQGIGRLAAFFDRFEASKHTQGK
jgi:hypothetical protein